jgi:hypothetical protein
MQLNIEIMKLDVGCNHVLSIVKGTVLATNGALNLLE